MCTNVLAPAEPQQKSKKLQSCKFMYQHIFMLHDFSPCLDELAYETICVGWTKSSAYSFCKWQFYARRRFTRRILQFAQQSLFLGRKRPNFLSGSHLQRRGISCDGFYERICRVAQCRKTAERVNSSAGVKLLARHSLNLCFPIEPRCQDDTCIYGRETLRPINSHIFTYAVFALLYYVWTSTSKFFEA